MTTSTDKTQLMSQIGVADQSSGPQCQAAVAETRRVLGRKANRHLLPHYDALRSQAENAPKLAKAYATACDIQGELRSRIEVLEAALREMVDCFEQAYEAGSARGEAALAASQDALGSKP